MLVDSKNAIKENAIKFLIWLMIGILTCMALTAMHVSDSRNSGAFYDVGKVYDIDYSGRSAPGYGYEQTLDYLKVAEDFSLRTILIAGKPNSWKFIDLDILYMNQKEMKWQLQYCDDKGNIISEDTFLIHEGSNLLSLNSEEFKILKIKIENNIGLKYIIKSMQLREEVPLFEIKRFTKLSLFYFLCYFIISSILMFIYKKIRTKTNNKFNLYILIFTLQFVFKNITNSIFIWIRKCPEFVRSFIRITIFLMLIINNIVTLNLNIHIKNWENTQLLYTFSILILAFISIEKRVEILDWRNKLVYSWFIFWFLGFLSDIIIQKKFYYVSIIQLIFWSYFFFIWNNMRKPEQILKEIIYSLNISFYIGIIYCMICRPEVTNVRYNGLYFNTNSFASYLAIIFIITLSQIADFIRKKRNVAIIRNAVKLSLILTFLWKTQSRGAIGVVLLMAVIFIFYILFKEKKLTALKYILELSVIVTLTIIPVYHSVTWILQKVPYILNLAEEFDIDDMSEKEDNFGFMMKAHAESKTMDSEEIRLIQVTKYKDIELLTSGRTLHWNAYIRNMNLWGHEFKAEVMGRERDPHNSLLMIAYRYGIYAVIPYILLLMLSLCKSFKKFFESNASKYYFLIFGFVLNFIILSMIDSMEQPYIHLTWTCMFLTVGYLFHDRPMEDFSE